MTTSRGSDSFGALLNAQIRCESAERTSQPWLCHLALSLLAESRGGPQPHNTVAGDPSPIVDDRLRALQARLQRKSGIVTCTAFPHTAENHVDVQHSFELAFSALVRGRADLADGWIETFEASEQRAPLHQVQCNILLAQSAKVGAHAAQSSRHIRAALAAAQDAGLVEIFVRAGPELLSLIACSSDPDDAFRKHVLARARDASLPLHGAELHTPLTKREVEVLMHLPSHHTNQELAEMCFISVNTLKTHMVHIYQKLNAANRSAAVLRARELGLL